MRNAIARSRAECCVRPGYAQLGTCTVLGWGLKQLHVRTLFNRILSAFGVAFGGDYESPSSTSGVLLKQSLLCVILLSLYFPYILCTLACAFAFIPQKHVRLCLLFRDRCKMPSWYFKLVLRGCRFKASSQSNHDLGKLKSIGRDCSGFQRSYCIIVFY